MLASDSHFAFDFSGTQVRKKRRKTSLCFWHYFHFPGTKGACSHTWTCRSAMCVQQATPVLPPMLASLTNAFGARQQTQRHSNDSDAVGAQAISSPPPCRHLFGLGCRHRHRHRRSSPPPRAAARHASHPHAPAAVRRRAVPVTQQRSLPYARIIVPVSVTGSSARVAAVWCTGRVCGAVVPDAPRTRARRRQIYKDSAFWRLKSQNFFWPHGATFCELGL